MEHVSRGNVRKRGNVWWMYWSERQPGSDASHQVRRSTQTHRKDDALRVLEEARREREEELKVLHARHQRGLPGEVRVSNLLARYEAEELPHLSPGGRRSYGYSLERVREFFVVGEGDPEVGKVRRPDVKRFLSWRVREGKVSPKTANKDFRVLKRVLSYAEEMELREGNPARGVRPLKTDARDPVLLTDEQLDALLGELGDRPMSRLYVLLLAETGLRSKSEALQLRWEDLDLVEGYLAVTSGRDGHRTKSGRSRSVPLTPRLWDALVAHEVEYRGRRYRGQPSPWVFHRTRGRGAGTPYRDLRGAVLSAAERAGISPDWRIHDLRHRRVTKWLAEGQSPVLVQEAMGHSAMAVTQGYTHLARTHLRALVSDREAPAPGAPVEARS